MGTKPVVVNNLNIPKPPAGQPTLLTFDEVNTAFHEFGHALHGLFSNVQYPQFSGTNVPRDFVEYPSQYNEMWATEPRVLANYAKHYQTGARDAEGADGQGARSAQVQSGLSRRRNTSRPRCSIRRGISSRRARRRRRPTSTTFEAAALKNAGVDFYAVPPRYRSTYFSHVFASPIGYSAGYYAYIWSEVLARDTEHWFNTQRRPARARTAIASRRRCCRAASASMR